jgi:aspartate-semialdehyde dehydrogenase
MEAGCHIALYGAAGAMGEQVIIALEGEGFPIHALTLVGGGSSSGNERNWMGQPTPILTTNQVSLDALDAAILAVPDHESEVVRDALIEHDVLVIDLTSSAAESDWPIIWPYINKAQALEHSGGLRLPCGIGSTLLPILASIKNKAAIRAVQVDALYGASHFGKAGERALSDQTLSMLNYRVPDAGPFNSVLAFDVLPSSGASDIQESARVAQELEFILGLSQVEWDISTVSVPVFNGLSATVSVTIDGDVDACIKAISPGRELSLGGQTRSLRLTFDNDKVIVARLWRRSSNTIGFQVLADPLHRIGCATAEVLGEIIRNDAW